MSKTYLDLLRNMKQKSDEFGSYLADVSKLNLDIQQRVDKLQDCIHSLSSNQKKACTVCYSRPPTHAFLPCGHGGICETCADRGLTRNRCFQCRAPIERVVRIYT